MEEMRTEILWMDGLTSLWLYKPTFVGILAECSALLGCHRRWPFWQNVQLCWGVTEGGHFGRMFSFAGVSQKVTIFAECSSLLGCHRTWPFSQNIHLCWGVTEGDHFCRMFSFAGVSRKVTIFTECSALLGCHRRWPFGQYFQVSGCYTSWLQVALTFCGCHHLLYMWTLGD